jgi:predicted RNA-binding protein with TRAM domain
MQQRRNFRSRPSYGGGGGGDFARCPVKVGDELDVTIEAVGEKGDGIAKKDGFVLFVPGVKEGAQVKVRVTKVLRKVGFAELLGEGAAPAKEKAEEAPEEESEESEEAPEATEEEAPEAPEEDAAPEAPEDSETFGEDEE